MSRGWLKALIPMVALGLLAADPVLAQPEEKPWVEPGIQMLEFSRPYAQWGLGLLFLGLCAAIGFKNPHRTHLD